MREEDLPYKHVELLNEEVHYLIKFKQDYTPTYMMLHSSDNNKGLQL